MLPTYLQLQQQYVRQVLGFSTLSQLLVVQLVLSLYTIIPQHLELFLQASLLRMLLPIHFQCVILYWSHSSNKCCYTRYCFLLVNLSTLKESTNRYKSSQWWWSPYCRKNPQAADLSVDLTNSIIPRQWVGSVTYTRASIATITDHEWVIHFAQ